MSYITSKRPIYKCDLSMVRNTLFIILYIYFIVIIYDLSIPRNRLYIMNYILHFLVYFYKQLFFLNLYEKKKKADEIDTIVVITLKWLFPAFCRSFLHIFTIENCLYVKSKFNRTNYTLITIFT